MRMYNLIEYSDNFSESTGTLWNFMRNETNGYNAITIDNLKSYNYKQVVTGDNGVLNDINITVPLKYLSNFFRSLEMPLINCKLVVELNWKKQCILTTTELNNANVNNSYVNFVINNAK